MKESTTRVVPSDQVLCQKVGGESVLLDLKSEQYFGLDEVGTRIWELLGERRAIDEVEQILLTEYEARPEQIARDLRVWIDKLLAAGLVSLDGSDHPRAR